MTAQVNFISLSVYNQSWDQYHSIDTFTLIKNLACAIYYNLNVPTIARFLNPNYLDTFRDIKKLKKELHGKVPKDLIEELISIFTIGAATKLTGEVPYSQALENRIYGNHQSINLKPDKVTNIIVKEVNRCYIMTFPIWLQLFVQNTLTHPCGLLVKPFKKYRQVFTASWK